jgi:hypothetical protein
VKITIDTDEVSILESYESYNEEYQNAITKGHRRWGRISWLHPGDLVIRVGGSSAKTINEAFADEEETYT